MCTDTNKLKEIIDLEKDVNNFQKWFYKEIKKHKNKKLVNLFKISNSFISDLKYKKRTMKLNTMFKCAILLEKENNYGKN